MPHCPTTGIDQEAAARISVAFTRILRKWLGRETIGRIQEENKELPAGVCASHDYCDANVPMAIAFRAVMRRNMDVQSPADCALWGAAWDHFRSTDS